MQLIKPITAILLISVGLFFLLAIATELVNPDASPDSKIGLAAGGLTLGLPALAAGGWLLWNEYHQSRQKIENRSRRIDSIFFHLIVQNNGAITAGDLAKFTRLSEREAEMFLAAKAAELRATRRLESDGRTVYYFPVNEGIERVVGWAG